MTQKSLIPDETTLIGVDKVMPPVERPAQPSALATLREYAMSAPVETMMSGLTEFATRRDAFRKWLLAQLKEGIHYGWPPGTEPKWGKLVDGRQVPCTEKEATGVIGKSFTPMSSWTHKKSLYGAGADFVCELLGIRADFASDDTAWKQSGAQAGTYVIECTLTSRATGEVLANGLGMQMSGSEHLGQNAALKKACKRAKVAAVIDYLGLRDLFTQDIEDGSDKPLVTNPEAKPDAPTVKTRGKRCDPKELGKLVASYKAIKHPGDHKPEIFGEWASQILGRAFDKPLSPDEWSAAEVETCIKSLEDGR